MIRLLLATNAVLAVAAGVAVLVARSRFKRLASAEAALKAVGERVERLNKVLERNEKIGEAADAQRAELAATEDGGLADRANDLFGG